MLTDGFHMKHCCFYLVRVYKFVFTFSIFILNFLFPISNIPFSISQLHLTSHFIKMPLQRFMHSVMYGKCIRLCFHSVCICKIHFIVSFFFNFFFFHCCCCSLVNLGHIFVGAPRDVVELEKDL